MEKLLIIGAGEMQVPVIKKAKELGYITVVTDFSENAPGFKYADHKCIVSTYDFAGNYKIAKKYNVNGILTTSDYPVNTVAYICNKLNFIGLSEVSAKICTDKYLQRKTLLENSIEVPKFIKFNGNEFDVKSIKEFNFPLIIKPLNSSGSRGVIKINHTDDIKNAIKESLKYTSDKLLLIEEFISGKEYSVEILVQNKEIHIIAITQKELLKSTYSFVETRHIIPAQISDNIKERIINYSKSIIKTIGLDNSAAHLELKITNKGEPILIEIGARLGGDYITSDLIPLAKGIDMLKNVINISLGLKIEVNECINKFAGVQFITSENYYSSLELIETSTNLVKKEIKEFKKTTTTNSIERLGYYIASDDSLKKLLNSLNYEKK